MNTLPLQRIVIEFAQGDDDASQVADFLFLFRGAYAAAVTASRDLNKFELDASVSEAELRAYLRRLNPQQIDSLFSADLGPFRLQLASVTQESPRRFVFMGMAGALVSASLLISGGKVEGRGPAGTSVSVTLNPIGTGIRELREALQPQGVPLGYGLKTETILLSREEMDELRKEPQETKDRGGFQRFLVGLANRTNLRTGALELSPQDVARIRRYAQSGPGGWQTRIHRIFGRHIDLTEMVFIPEETDE
jgi:hypothetical protein